MTADRDPIEELWVHLLAMYGHRFESAHGRTPAGIAGDTWRAALADIDPIGIGRGLDACLRSGEEWPPSAPQFRAMCLGIPSLAHVRHNVTKHGAEREAFTRLTWQFLDGYAFSRAPQDNADRMLRDAYDLAREHVMAGGALPEGPVNYLEQAAKQPVEPATPEKVRAVMADIANVLGADPADIVEVSAFEAPDSLHHHQVKTHDGTAVTIVNPWRLDRFELQKRVRVAWANQHAEPADPAPARAFGDDQERAA